MNFKVRFSHDLMNKDPEKRKKKTGLVVEVGYDCRNSCWCPHGSKCKYRGRYKFHNAMVRIQQFFRYRLGWKNFKIPVYFQSHSTDLSGTTMCPHHMPRMKTCWDCGYSCGDQQCSCRERIKLVRADRWQETHVDDPDWGSGHRCKFWTPGEWFDRYDRKTGDTLWGNKKQA